MVHSVGAGSTCYETNVCVCRIQQRKTNNRIFPQKNRERAKERIYKVYSLEPAAAAHPALPPPLLLAQQDQISSSSFFIDKVSGDFPPPNRTGIREKRTRERVTVQTENKSACSKGGESAGRLALTVLLPSLFIYLFIFFFFFFLGAHNRLSRPLATFFIEGDETL